MAAAQVSPIFGMGMGAGTQLYQPHNQVVSEWINLGFFGALLYVSILVILGLQSLAAGFRAFYCVIPLVAFIPVSQFLTAFTPYWYAVVAASFAVAGRVWSLRAASLDKTTNPGRAPAPSAPAWTA